MFVYFVNTSIGLFYECSEDIRADIICISLMDKQYLYSIKATAIINVFSAYFFYYKGNPSHIKPNNKLQR